MSNETLIGDGPDLKLFYVNSCSVMLEAYKVVVQGSAEVPAFSELFYTQVGVNNNFELSGMIDSGSMACTMSEAAENLLSKARALVGEPQSGLWGDVDLSKMYL